MSNIVKASELSGPTISGKVSVELHELDKMRSDHARAVKLAQDLEDKQAKVLVVYSEQCNYNSRNGGYDKKELSRQYVHFEDFRNIIAEEEAKKVQKKVDSLITERDGYRTDLNNTNSVLGTTKSDYESLKKRYAVLQANHVELENSFAEASASIETQANELTMRDARIVEQQTVINDLLVNNKHLELKKSFWGFLVK